MKLSDLTIVYDYKEPLATVSRSVGFGYYGCISGSQDLNRIQCHICGKLFRDLNVHARNVHELTPKDYKDKFSLAYETKLISPKMKQERRDTYMATFNLKEREKNRKKALKASMKATTGKVHARSEISLETKNKRGSCPNQVIAKILEVTKKLGHQPSQREFMIQEGGEKYFRYIRRTFKTWNEAIKVAKLVPKTKKENSHKGKYQRRHPGKRGYSKEELVEYLRLFTQEEQRIPRCCEFGLGILPHIRTYQNHFGTLEKARSVSGVYDLV